MKKRSIVGSLLGVSAVMVVSAVAPATAAQAAPAAYVCQRDEICVYEGSGFTGSVHVFKAANPGLWDFPALLYTNHDNMNDTASSIDNLSGLSVRAYEDIEAQGSHLTIPKDSGDLTLNFPAAQLDNKVSSIVIG